VAIGNQKKHATANPGVFAHSIFDLIVLQGDVVLSTLASKIRAGGNIQSELLSL